MEALKLTQNGTEILTFPNSETKEKKEIKKEIKIASFVNARSTSLKRSQMEALQERNRKAQAYSESCANKRKSKRKEMVSEIISAIFLIGSLSFFWLQLFI